jgi:hypothetical protein
MTVEGFPSVHLIKKRFTYFRPLPAESQGVLRYGNLQKPNGKNLRAARGEHRHYQPQGADENLFSQDRLYLCQLEG